MTAYWGTRGAGTLIFAADTGRVLLLHRSIHVLEPGLWGIPGGRVEEGAGVHQTAIVETEEECGPIPGLVVDAEPCHVWRAPEGTFVYYTFRARVPVEFEPVLNWESDDYRWGDPARTSRDHAVHPNVRRALGALGFGRDKGRCS